MNRRMSTRLFSMVVAAGLLLGFSACQKPKPHEEQVAAIDRVGSSPQGTSQALLHKSFAVRGSVAFPFKIPAHAAMPHLRGNYKSFVAKLGIQSNEDSANVDFFIVTEEQYADFMAGTGESIFSTEASHDQSVDFNLPPSLNQAKKYYLIFRNAPGSDAKTIVQADLTVDF